MPALAPPLLFRQFFTATGAVAAGHKLFTYITGTTTNKQTFSDAAGTVANANPITLDAEGRCALFLETTGSYRFRLETAGGALVAQQDDIAGLVSAVSTAFVPLAGGTMTGLLTLSGNATANLNPAPLQQVNSLIAAAVATLTVTAQNAVPIGTVAMWLRPTPPTNWLECAGQAVSRVTYASLFALFGVTFGPGDGSTTFNLPEMRGEFPRFWDDARGVDSGRGIGTAQADQVKTHTHNTTIGRATATGNAAAPAGGLGELGLAFPFTLISDTGAGTGAEQRVRNFSVMPIVKAL